MERIRELYKLHKEAVFRYFLRMSGNRVEAEELTQETFYQACLSVYRFKGKSSLKTWLFSIARNVYLKHIRKKITSKTAVWEENLIAHELNSDKFQSPAEILILKEEQKMIQKVLAQLSENARTVIILKEYEELSYEEIAEIFGQTVNWARVTFFRAKNQFRRFYRELEEGRK